MPRSKLSLSIYNKLSAGAHFLFPKTGIKYKMEYLYWWNKKRQEKTLTNFHYEHFYTSYFGLTAENYKAKKVLDIGCGPRGSLEWATEAEAYGLDPLVDEYKKLGIDQHQMKYVKAGCEQIPFENDTFDIIASFNSLDHVDELDLSIKEIKRVLKPTGFFLLISDIHDHPTMCEPSAFSWDIVKRFSPELQLVSEKQYEGEKLYQSIREGVKFDHNNSQKRYGVLTALFKKV
ncbi:MAG: class I SAM-dependent methyltransferase [Bacteroidia bacterium]|nr:class I SAM-dependent methyltransferase [Bacteroidia bacterium]